MGNGKKRAEDKDRQIGANIRRLRIEAGLSQKDTAGRLGISYQQVQKYERGKSRVAASTLYELAAFYHVAPARFFEGLGDALPQDLREHDDEALKILALVSRIEDPVLKRKIGRIVGILAA